MNRGFVNVTVGIIVVVIILVGAAVFLIPRGLPDGEEESDSSKE